MINLKKISWILLLAGMVLAASSAVALELKLDKDTFSASESIKVHFTASADYAENAWVGIIPSDVPHGSEAKNDQHDVSYQYLKKRTSGTLTFKAPSKPGNYDFRMNDTDNNGKEVTSVSFTVKGGPTLKLNKAVFQPGDEIQVNFTAPSDYAKNAWVGIIPSQVPHGSEAKNDQHDVSYQYLKKRASGTLTFKAPSKPGNYDFRMNDTDNNGKEVTSVSFTVSQKAAGGPTLELDKAVFQPGDEIQVNFTAPSNYAENAWVGVIPSDVPHGSEAKNDQHDVSYQYLKKRTSGTLTFKAPSKPGNYDFRMNDTDNNGKEVTSVSFTVSG